jgi:hypothetical protein
MHMTDAWVERSLDGFTLYPEKLIGDTAYINAEMLKWLVMVNRTNWKAVTSSLSRPGLG